MEASPSGLVEDESEQGMGTLGTGQPSNMLLGHCRVPLVSTSVLQEDHGLEGSSGSPGMLR